MACDENLLKTTICDDATILENIRSRKKPVWTIPYAGNGFVQKSSTSAVEVITSNKLGNWNSSSTVISLYFYSRSPGRVLAALRLYVPRGTSKATVSMVHNTLNNPQSRHITFEGSEYHFVNCGYFDISMPGYTRFDLQGMGKTGGFYGDVSHLILLSDTDSLVDPACLKFVSDPNDFYFGRRGPSVHLWYSLPAAEETEYFYNEVTVPKGQDVIGAYFCAIGFSGGYFGIQVNSEKERRILFSIWSAYKTDNPQQIPQDYKVNCIKNGKDVYIGEFGNEGSGAQSYLRYMWQPDKTYRFIVRAKPIDPTKTMYSAWFKEGTSEDGWMLIASFEKPKVSTFFKGPYSFSENFKPETGYMERHCIFSNQWARSVADKWTECTSAKFTADAAANKQIRMDVCGGVGIDGDRTNFFLRNCGFLSDRVEPGTNFTRECSGTGPLVEVSLLP
ncbi:hypothetical protein Ocin01_15097 [Orchesella cincta]|uniref:DUF5077 domain-containing protein n=1 Tax=Orchesella cincta TaxID=48709 RepID=A0A1D2MF17_ORCCI|nr:hypothetical protein Ocin01_15097 [Orchesella cincta]